MSSLRELERVSIRSFVESCAEHFTGRVLDYGCGNQPYRDIVEAAGGEYLPYDRAEFPANVSQEDIGFMGVSNWMWAFDAILCTQVIQYLPAPALRMQQTIVPALNPGGVLVMTYPTCWPEAEEADLRRFTKAGMTRLLVDAGFVIERHERRAEIEWKGEVFALGYGVVARAS